MANIRARRNKDGKITSYTIRVSRGYDASGKQLKPWTTSFPVPTGWSEKTAEKKAAAYAATFEKACREGTATDTRLKFGEYAGYVIDLKESRGELKHATIVRYKELLQRIIPEIGHLKLRDIRPDVLNDFYTRLSSGGSRKTAATAAAKVDLLALLKVRKITQISIAKASGIPISGIADAVHGKPVHLPTAQAVADALGTALGDLFNVDGKADGLCAATVRKYHNFISSVLEFGVREGILPSNAARRAMPPKLQHHEAAFLQPEVVDAVLDALKTEPSLKWQVLIHLLLITGCRRGELLALKWAAVDFDANRLHVCANVVYRSDRGVYIDTPKTPTSDRWITLPAETMQLLRRYRAWQAEERLRLGAYFQDQGFVFAQDTGAPMHPDTVTTWLDHFAKRHDLPHLSPHMFRHTAASALLFNGVDVVTVASRLGHAQTSTTMNIYGHVLKQADQRSADVLASVFLKKA